MLNTVSRRSAKSNQAAMPALGPAHRRTVRQALAGLTVAIRREQAVSAALDACPDDCGLATDGERVHFAAQLRTMDAERRAVRAILASLGLAKSEGRSPIFGFTGPARVVVLGSFLAVVGPPLASGLYDGRSGEPSISLFHRGQPITV